MWCLSVPTTPPHGWLSAANRRMRRQPAWFLLVFLVVNGLQVSDARDFALLAGNPLALLPSVDKQFLHGSPFTFFIAAPIASLAGGHVALAVTIAAGLLLLALALRRFLGRFSAPDRETLTIVLLSTPLLLVLTRWMGKSDLFLVGFYLLLAASDERGIVKTCLAVLVVLCHREIGSIVLAVHLLLCRRDLLPVLAGLALGHLLVLGYFFALLPSPPHSRVDFAHHHVTELLRARARAPIGHVLFSLNWFWIFLVVFLGQTRASRDRLCALLLGGLLLVGALAFDYTRVVSLCALPIVLHIAVRLTRTNALPSLLGRAPFPLLFLAQFQIEGRGQIHDWSWLR